MRNYAADVNVRDFGALGYTNSVKGSIKQGSWDLSVQNDLGWIEGAGVAIPGAGEGVSTLVTRLNQIDKTDPKNIVFHLRDSAVISVQDVIVTSDDRVPIQEAIYSVATQGGTVHIPRGIYVIGTTSAKTNQPLIVYSNLRLTGAGRANTILRLPDRVKQIAPAQDPNITAAGLIVNQGNSWWFGKDPIRNEYPRPDTSVTIEHMTLDGNKDGQTDDYMHGNLTSNPPLPDPLGILASGTNLNGTLASGPYQVCITYGDKNGQETGKSVTTGASVGGNQNAIQVDIPTTPPGVEWIVVYLRDAPIDQNGNDTGPHDQMGNALFERQTPIKLPLNDPNVLTITMYTKANATVIPPGTGLIGKYAEAGDRDGIFLDNCTNFYIHDLEIRNFVLDGIAISSNTDLFVRDSIFDAIWTHDNGRTGMAITGKAQSLRFADSWFDRNPQAGFDIDPIQSNIPDPIEDIHLIHCRFMSNYSGFNADPWEMTPDDNVSLTNCEFIDNVFGFIVQGEVGRATNFRLMGCTFRKNRNYACLIIAAGYGLITGCDFDRNSIATDYNKPGYIEGATLADQLLFEDNSSNWRVIGNRFRPIYNAGAIEIRGKCSRLIIVNNHFETGWTGQHYFVSAAQGHDVVRSGHIIHSNTGEGLINDLAGNPVGTSIGLNLAYLEQPPFVGKISVNANATSADITLNPVLPNVNYQVVVYADWDFGSWSVKNKAVNGFTLVWTNPAPAQGGSLDWTVFP